MAPQEPAKDTSVETFISQAIQSNVPIETLERLLAMRDKIKAERAKELFDSAMADLQGEIPMIQKTKEVKTNSGKVAYKYAPIESIVEQIKPYLQKHGFSYSSSMEVLDNGVKATIKVKHRDGHFETSEMQVPLGNKTDIMSASQVVAAAQTFAKRYAFCNAFGIMTGDEDTDGKDIGKDAPKIDYKAKLAASRNLAELKAVWETLPVAEKIELEGLKSDLKMSLEN